MSNDHRSEDIDILLVPEKSEDVEEMDARRFPSKRSAIQMVQVLETVNDSILKAKPNNNTTRRCMIGDLVWMDFCDCWLHLALAGMHLF